MKTLDLIINLILFVLFIGHIESLNNGETVYNGNIIVLDSISNWKFRQAKDEITIPNDSKYFLIEENDNLNLKFKDNINNKDRFKDLDDSCSKVNVHYSFDYYLDLNAKVKILNWNINLLKKDQDVVVVLKKWSTISNNLVIDLDDLKSKHENNEIFEMFLTTDDRYKNDKYKSITTTRFSIKNLKLKFLCEEEVKNELNFDFNSNKNYVNSFTVLHKDKVLDNDELINYWSNSIYPKFEQNKIDKYYYSERIFDNLNLAIAEKDFKKEEELCLTFDYYISKSAFLTIKFKNSRYQNSELLKLYTTEIDERLIDAKNLANNNLKYKWNQATYCVKGESLSSNRVPQWIFESFIYKSELKTDIIAVTNFKATRKLQDKLKNYLPNWKFNGESSLKDWTLIPEERTNFKLDLNDKNELRLNLLETPSTSSKRHYYMISDWFLMQNNTEVKFLTFKLNSNLTNYHLQLNVLIDLAPDDNHMATRLENIDYKSWNLNESFEEKTIQFNFKNVLDIITNIEELNGEGRLRILFEIYNNKLINPSNEMKTIKKSEIRQLLTISEIQLDDQCTDELICNRHGKCNSIEAAKFTCKCDEGFHGENCEYRNSCILKNVQLDNSMTGSEFCKARSKTKCIPNNDEFLCECNENEYWNSESLKCVAISDCLFTPCGINEQCVMKGLHKPACECKDKHVLRDGICQKDLCLTKKCRNNMICIHIEGKSYPECGCPLGMIRQGDECIDLRDPESPYSIINPFILQKSECDQYYTLENGEVQCDCLPGYQMNSDEQCEPKFNIKDPECRCNDKQTCIKHDSGEFECVCKPGYLGEDCKENICKKNKPLEFCGENSCEISDNGKFVCNCDKNIYKLNDFGLCDMRDVCAEEKITCDENAVCFTQLTNNHGELKVSASCGCRRALIGSTKTPGVCVDVCNDNPTQCSDLPFTECKYAHNEKSDNEVRCECARGMWRKNNEDPCTPVKSSLLMNVIFTPLNTDQNPIREKVEHSEGDKLGVYIEEEEENNYIRSSQINFTIPKFIRSKFRKLSIDEKKEVVSHKSIHSLNYPCLTQRLDLETCIETWNAQFEKVNKIAPQKELNKNYIESVLRSSLLETFNHKNVFDKKIESIKILEFKPLTRLDHEHFGLKTFYSVQFLVQSNHLELTPKSIQDVFDKKCKRKTREVQDGMQTLCSLEELGLFTLSNLDLKEYDLCETGALTCPDYNYCYSNRKEEKDWDFSRDRVAYECRCRKGFKSVGKNKLGPYLSFYNHTCEDINECERPELNDCDDESTTCANTIGSFECKCDQGYKPLNRTHCLELCSKTSCEHGTCLKVGDHEDRCKCNKGWAGPACNVKSNISDYKSALIIVIISAAVILVITVVALLIYSRNYSNKRVVESTAALRHELEMVRIRNQNTNTVAVDNPAFDSNN